jgi:hypothetical protein
MGSLLLVISGCSRVMARRQFSRGVDRIHYSVYRVWLPLLMGWFFVGTTLPDALGAPFPVTVVCHVLGWAPLLALFLWNAWDKRAAKRRATKPSET